MSKPTTTVMRGPSGFPDRIRVKLNYYTTINADSTTGSTTFYQFRGNSLYDPDFTSTGDQPNAFDQWSTFYSKYRVSGSALRVVSCIPGESPMSGSQSVGVVVVIAPTISSTATSVTDYAELAYSKMRSTTYYTPVRNFSSYMSTAKLMGVNKAAVKDEDNNAALVTTNPANVWFWNVLMIPGNSSQTQTSYVVVVKLTYYAELFGRNILGTS